MGEEFGRLRLEDPRSGGYTFDFGVVTNISESFSKSCTTTPLASLPMENAFCIESKTSKVFTIRFTRVQPLSPSTTGADSARWPNALWYTRLMSSLSRWQCKTDGYRLTFTPSGDNPYIAPIPGTEGIDKETGYIRNMQIQYDAGNDTVLSGTFEFHVGTMYVKSAPPEGTEYRMQRNFQITMSNSRGQSPCILLGTNSDGTEINCIDSYTMYSGPENPFEYIVMKIPRKKLAQVAPSLINGNSTDIVAGKNTLIVSAVGTSFMTVSKVKMDGDTVTITAYCNAEKLRGFTLTNGGNKSPTGWIQDILTTSNYGVNFSGNLIRQYDESESIRVGMLRFNPGTQVWTVLQVAAMCVGARVFFTDNKAYVVDYRYIGEGVKDYGKIDLYPRSGDFTYRSNIIGKVNLGDEGVDTIINSMVISCSTPEMDGDKYAGGDGYTAQTYKTYKYTATDPLSIQAFQEKVANTVNLPELIQNDPEHLPKEEEKPGTGEEGGDTGGSEGGDTGGAEGGEGTETEPKKEFTLYDQAATFASNYLSYRSEPQQSVSFTLKEMRMVDNEPAWHPFFTPASVASAISDEADEIYVDNISVLRDTPATQKLVLSSCERSYPKGTSKYTWGVMSSIDLASSTSQINTNLNNIS